MLMMQHSTKGIAHFYMTISSFLNYAIVLIIVSVGLGVLPIHQYF